MDTYHDARMAMHTRYLALDEQAYQLLRRINLARANGGDYRQLTRIADRAERRWHRRRSVVQWLGMDEQQIQALDIGDTVHWRGRTLTVIDWKCHRDPVYGSNARRIWAEPLFRNEKGQSVYVAPIFWYELI